MVKISLKPHRARSPWTPPLVIVLLFGLDALLCLAYGLDLFAGRPSYQLGILLDLDGEANVPAWYSSVKLFGIALLFAAFALSQGRVSRRTSWGLLILPLLFLVLSLDEIAQLHEWLGRKSDALLAGGTREGTFFKNTGIWMFLLGGPFLAVLGALGWSLRARFAIAPRALPLFATGILVFLAGAVGVEAASNMTTVASGAYVVLVVIEEGLEMLGATVILWSAHELLAGKGFFLGWETSAEERSEVVRLWPSHRAPAAAPGRRAGQAGHRR